MGDINIILPLKNSYSRIIPKSLPNKTQILLLEIFNTYSQVIFRSINNAINWVVFMVRSGIPIPGPLNPLCSKKNIKKNMFWRSSKNAKSSSPKVNFDFNLR